MTGPDYHTDLEAIPAAGTEAEAVARIVRESALDPIEDAGWFAIPLPPGWRLHTEDTSRRLPEPLRPTGTIVVHDAPSFLGAVSQRHLDGRPPIVYADDERLALVAILNDDQADTAGWRDYRVELALRPTPEWRRWKAKNDSPMTQEDFSAFVEEHARDFRQPAAVEMLELATTIEGTKTAQFKAGVRLKDGSRQVGWTETVDARAGQTGQLTIPDRFLIAVRPFIGAAPFEIEAWLRFRISDGHLRLSYKLDRPDLVERAVFDDIVLEVADDDDLRTIIRGPAPS